MLNQQPNRTSKLISDCFEDRGPLVFYKQHLYEQPSTQVMEQQATEYSTPSINKQPPKNEQQ